MRTSAPSAPPTDLPGLSAWYADRARRVAAIARDFAALRPARAWPDPARDAEALGTLGAALDAVAAAIAGAAIPTAAREALRTLAQSEGAPGAEARRQQATRALAVLSAAASGRGLGRNVRATAAGEGTPGTPADAIRTFAGNLRVWCAKVETDRDATPAKRAAAYRARSTAPKLIEAIDWSPARIRRLLASLETKHAEAVADGNATLAALLDTMCRRLQALLEWREREGRALDRARPRQPSLRPKRARTRGGDALYDPADASALDAMARAMASVTSSDADPYES